MNVFAIIVDAIIEIYIKNSTTKFAINFVVISINFNNFVLSSFYYVIENQFFEQILFSKITIYDDFKIRDKFVNVINNYSNL